MKLSVQNLKHIFDLALKNHQSGHFKEAEKLYNKILKNFPDHFQSIFLLGTLFAQIKNYKAAITLLKKAIHINPRYLDAYNNLGNVYREIESNQEAILYYKQIIKIDPKYIEAHNNLGKIYNEIEDYPEAISFFKTVIRLSSKHIEALNNLGVLFRQQGQLKEATSYYRKVLELDPEDLEALNNLGVLFRQQGKYQEALNNYEKAIKINPKYLEAYTNIGNVLKDLGKHSKAIKIFQKINKIKPNYLVSHWLSLNTFPIIYKNTKELDIYRKRFEKSITKINKLLDTKSNYTKKQIINALETSTNYYLHYQGKNDLELQKKYAQLIERLSQKIYPQFHKDRNKNVSSQNIKIGFISSFFRNHSVSKVYKNWILKLDKNIYKIFVYYADNKFDQITNTIKEYADNFFNHTNVDRLINQISKDDLDVLLYLDIGMDPKMQILGSLRLAPIQCNTWGHPITSGLKNIDYFFSSQLMEKKDSQKNYSEKLINLPGIGIDYNHADISNIKKTNVLNKFNKTVFFNLQSLFKLLPQDDHIYLDILKKHPNSCFWFIQGKSTLITSILKERVSKLFKKEGLSFKKYSYFHPRCQQNEFLGLIEQSDIILDSFNWSGCNSSLEAISLNKPIVTLPGAFMRGRHAYSFLKVLNIEETIANTKKEYVKISVKLATDSNFKNSVINKIKKNKNKLFNDEKPIRFLEEFFKNKFKI